NQNHLVTFDGCRHRQGNSGITAGRFNQGIAGADLPPTLRLLNHAQCRAVLDRARRIITLQLHQNGITGLSWKTLQPDKRRGAYIIFNGWEYHAQCLVSCSWKPSSTMTWGCDSGRQNSYREPSVRPAAQVNYPCRNQRAFLDRGKAQQSMINF